jgi:hypothetical protein
VITRYRLVAARLRTEMPSLEQLVARADAALERATRQPQDQDYFLAAAALDLHGFYAGLERLFELIAEDVDRAHPHGSRWHRDLLAQMTLEVERVRPAVLAAETSAALTDYLDFRHIVRNVYTFHLRPERVAELVRGLRPTFDLVRRDLTAFAQFLEELSTADQASSAV